MELQGQPSPRDAPLIAVREAGQIGPSPFINTFQSTGIGTMMTLEACVEGWERMLNKSLTFGGTTAKDVRVRKGAGRWCSLLGVEAPLKLSAHSVSSALHQNLKA